MRFIPSVIFQSFLTLESQPQLEDSSSFINVLFCSSLSQVLCRAFCDLLSYIMDCSY